MSQSEMDEAAHRLLQANQGETPLPYFDHLGGYELQDYTQRSSPHEHSRSREGRLRLNSESTNHEEEDDDDDDDDDDDNDETPKPKETDRDMVYVTTLQQARVRATTYDVPQSLRSSGCSDHVL